MREGLGIPGNISIVAYRVSIGLYYANRKMPKQKSSLLLLYNALCEIIFAYTFIAFFMASVLKNSCTNAFFSMDIFSSLIGLFSSKKLFNNNHMTLNDLNFLLFPIMLESFVKNKKINPKNLSLNLVCLLFSIKISKFLHLCGDVELNPGDTFDFCLWNCNSISAHDFNRVSLLETYNSIHKLKIMALTETGLKPSMDNSNIEIPGFSIIRNDLPIGHTHGGVMIYYKNDLAIKQRPDLQLHTNTLVVEIKIARKKVIFILAYRKFGQTAQEFNIFQEKIDEMIKKSKNELPHCIILTGDLNAHLSEWYGDDDNFGLTFQRIFNKYGISQLIHEPTYLTNRSKTCIDILATDQPNLVLKSEVHPSLHTNCHHQVIYSKININCPPPPPHTRHIWHYSRAKVDSMQKASFDYDWDQALNDSPPDQQIDHYDNTIINIAKNFIPNEFKKFNAKEPPWITKSCKNIYSKYKKKYKIFAKYNYPPEKKNEIDELKKSIQIWLKKKKRNTLPPSEINYLIPK